MVEIYGKQPLNVLLVDQAAYNSFPDLSAPPLFRGEVIDKLSFTVLIPAADNYYLILDNRTGEKKSNMQIKIQASATAASLSQKSTPGVTSEPGFEKKLESLGTELEKIFMFDPFPIKAIVCSNTGVFSSPEGIILCVDFIKQVFESIGNQEKTTDVLIFALFHEVGHLLLEQWGYPFYDNEEIADEFASILLIVVGQKERLSSTAEYFLSTPSASEMVAKIFQDDRHPLSVQRSRNILRSIKNPEKTRRWLNFFIPHMQTAMLRKILDSQSSNFDLEVVRLELKKRESPD